MPTQIHTGFAAIPTSGWNTHEDLLNFPGYPQLVTWRGRTKEILAHPHGIEYHALEGGPLSLEAGITEPGTLLHWVEEEETDRNGDPITVWNLRPFIMGLPLGDVAPDGGEWEVDFTGTGTYDENAASRFAIGMHLWQADYTDWSVAAVDLGEVQSVDEDNNTINVENEPTIDHDISVIYVAEDDEGTFPTLDGVSFFWAGPTNVNDEQKKGSVISLMHAYVLRQKITNYGDILQKNNGSIEGALIRRKLRQDLPMLRIMW